MNVTKCVGNQLVRAFAKGTELKYVCTETIGGMTFTHVLAQDGYRIISRVKSFAKEPVGNKVVNTRTNVFLKTYDPDKYKSITDRVYSSDGRFLGLRHTYLVNGKKRSSAKKTINGDRFVKNFEKNGIVQSKAGISCLTGKFFMRKVYYNNKGLPMPGDLSKYDYDYLKDTAFKDRSLKDMKNWFAVNMPKGKNYLPKGYGPKSLNDINTDTVISPIIANAVKEFNKELKACL